MNLIRSKTDIIRVMFNPFMTYEMAFGWWADDGPLLYAYWVLTVQHTLNQKVRSQVTNEPRHEISNNVAFDKCRLHCSLYSLLLSFETSNAVRPVAEHS